VSETLSGDVQSRIAVYMYMYYMYMYLVRATYLFAWASNFTCRTVSWGGFMMGLAQCRKMGGVNSKPFGSSVANGNGTKNEL